VKIKTQSFILIAGIALMPVLVISLFFVVERLTFAAREASYYEELKFESSSPSAEEKVERIVNEKPKGMNMAVADPSGRVIYSSISAIPLGVDFESAVMEASRQPLGGRILTFGFTPPLPDGYVAVTSLTRSEFLPTRALSDLILVGILALAAILLFTAAMSILIVRSITRSVVSLEAATRRVASGELDLPIVVEGTSEIASLARSLNSLREEIKDDQSRRARFIMGISHDLKTPLALVKGYAEALEEELGDSSPDAEAHLSIIQAKADQLEGMIDDLIDFERVDTGEWSRSLARLDLASFLRAFVRRVEADAALLGRVLVGSIELTELSFVRMDERLVTRALENLVNNALRYTAAGGWVEVSARQEASGTPGGTRYVVTVTDDGPGISAEDLPHIFEPFYRGSSSRREQGMGLGLSIVKTVVESHGWRIEARPAQAKLGIAKGMAFVLTIPVSTPERG
jgi:signal transduction histidine kinase